MAKSNTCKQGFIGKELCVIGAKNKDNVGLNGKVIDETKFTLVVETRKGRKKLLKSNIKFTLAACGNIAEFCGKDAVGTQKDRIKR